MPGLSRAVALLLYTVTVWGANVVMMKIMTRHFETVHLSAIRMAAAFGCIALICRCAGHRVPWPDRRQLGWLVAAAALMIYAHQLMLTQGLAWSTATNGAPGRSRSQLRDMDAAPNRCVMCLFPTAGRGPQPRISLERQCPDCEVRIILRHTQLRTSQSKDTGNSLI